MEVVWEKGGSGLVFYTDASYWDQQEGGEDRQTDRQAAGFDMGTIAVESINFGKGPDLFFRIWHFSILVMCI